MDVEGNRQYPIGLDLVVLDSTGKPQANPATRGIPVFKEIFAAARRRRGDHKKAQETVLSEFLYIYYMIDIRSFAVQRFPNVREDQKRHDIVRPTLKLIEGWKPSQAVEDGADFYRENHESPSVKMLKGGFSAINVTIDFLQNVDYTLQDSKGRPVYEPKEVMGYLSDIQLQKKNLDALWQEVLRDINLGGRPKGGGSLNIFENPDTQVIENYARVPESI